MNKWELISKMAEKAKLRNSDVENMLEQFVASVIDALQKGDKVTVSGLGTFKVIQRYPREARNPATGEKVKTKGAKVVKFAAAKSFKEDVNNL